MDLLGPGRSIMAIFFLFVIIFPLGLVAVVNRPMWNRTQWETEFEIVRQNYSPNVKGGADGPIPKLIECVFNDTNKNAAKKFPPCDAKFREVLQNEILLRKQLKSHNEDCNSSGTKEGEDILNPPQVQINNPKSKINYSSYANWQEKLINSKLQFCDPLKFLRCSAEKKCVCHLNSTWSPRNEVRPEIRDKNTCAYFQGSQCHGHIGVSNPRMGALYFDPFSTSASTLIQIVSPRCREVNDDCYRGHEFLKEEATCLPKTLMTRLERLDNYFSFSPIEIFFNDQCDFEDHNRYFTSTRAEDENFELRIKNVEVLRDRRAKFCDLEKFLTCAASLSRTCECMPPSSRKDDKCILPEEYDQCLANPKMTPFNRTFTWKTREKVMTGFASIVSKTKCERNLTCHADMMELYCTCPPGKTGQECEEPLTKFLPIVRVPSLPTDVVGYLEKVKIFSQFNKKAIDFEKVFKIGENATCVWKSQNEAEIIVRQIRKLSYIETNMTSGQYDDLGKTIEVFTNKHQSKGICNVSLRCQFSTKKCVNQTRRIYLQDLDEELEKFNKILTCNQTGCSKFPKYDDVMFGGELLKFFGGSHEMEYNKLMEEHFTLLQEKAQFCNGSGICSGSIPPDTGTCECPMMVVNTGINVNGTKSLAPFRHLPNRILLMSVASIFVVNNY